MNMQDIMRLNKVSHKMQEVLEKELGEEIRKHKNSRNKGKDDTEFVISQYWYIDSILSVRNINSILDGKLEKFDNLYYAMAKEIVQIASMLPVKLYDEIFIDVVVEETLEKALDFLMSKEEFKSEALVLSKFIKESASKSLSSFDRSRVQEKRFILIDSKASYKQLMMHHNLPYDFVSNVTPPEFSNIKVLYEYKKERLTKDEMKPVIEELEERYGKEYLEYVDGVREFFGDKIYGVYHVYIPQLV